MPIDLQDLIFVSDDHIRYQNGRDVSGHNKNCWRGIRIQVNPEDIQGYKVTIYNMDGNHFFLGDNIQMAPKQMRIVEKSGSFIKLKGYGIDSTAASFSDYGITLHLQNELVDKITLHMYDRAIDIEYFKALNYKPQDPLSFKKQSSISENINEVIVLSETIHRCADLYELSILYDQLGAYNHPQISYDFGVAFLIRDDKENAKKALIEGAIYGLQFPVSIYNNGLVDSIGQCLAILMTQFPIGDISLAIKVTSLGYIYLSKCIELYPREAHDSYRTRGILFKDHENSFVVQNLILDNLGLGVIVEPFIISDFYFSSQAIGSPHKSALESAIRIHQNLEDITVGGKDADQYSLREMSEFGERRHKILFSQLERKYQQGNLNMSIDELRRANA